MIHNCFYAYIDMFRLEPFWMTLWTAAVIVVGWLFAVSLWEMGRELWKGSARQEYLENTDRHDY